MGSLADHLWSRCENSIDVKLGPKINGVGRGLFWSRWPNNEHLEGIFAGNSEDDEKFSCM